ncbi:MAG: hypothetical protein ABIH89_06990, partial [Elusimicrobiota bacterium]
MIKKILEELKHHMPFTFMGALTGIIVIFFFRRLPNDTAFSIFYIFHPLHVMLSAFVTASMYRIHGCRNRDKKCSFLILLLIGYTGSIGIATLSDSLIPYAGEILLDLPNRGYHIGFIEKWWLVNPLALCGILMAYVRPGTKFPHLGHVLLSTWASLFHILMATGDTFSIIQSSAVLFFLFISVWLPCCLSDIVFPLIFVVEKK